MNTSARTAAEGFLYTDQYQLTMGQLYFRMGLHEMPAQFDYFFRSYPNYGGHQAGYCVAAGLEWLLDWMAEARITDQDIEYLRSQMGTAGSRLFSDDYLDWLRDRVVQPSAGITIHAIPEGRLVHPGVPIVTVCGPLAVAQLLETSLLNHLNYQTLVATRASRIREAGQGRPLLEFGLRRAQERAATAGARAALIGGADFSSYVGLSRAVGLPPKGTHAHSMVQVFMALGHSELDAFRAFAEVYPDDCILLVDTVNTLESGVPNAIRVFEELRRKGHRPRGIRLDSGDLAHLATVAARMLNDAGFEDVSIVLSNQLDEIVLLQILAQIRAEAPRYGLDPEALVNRLVYGVGTQLVTSQGAAALDGVYKLVAVEPAGTWRPAIKLSETVEKIPNPGQKSVWRVYDQRDKATADLIAIAGEDPTTMDPLVLHHPVEHATLRRLPQQHVSHIEPLLAEVMRDGREVIERPTLEEMRQRCRGDLEHLDEGVRRIVNPHVYHVSLTHSLWQLKQSLIASLRAGRSL